MHSPFLFDFYCKVIKGRSVFRSDVIEKYRTQLLQSDSIITFKELGSSKFKKTQYAVKTKAATSLSPLDHSCFLSALVAFVKPYSILELGTSFGISTAYMASRAKDAKVVSIEGATSVAAIAKKFFESGSFNNIHLLEGHFDDLIVKATKEMETLDVVFFDGNHRYEPTMKYFNHCLSMVNEKTVFIFHDIYWSQGMKLAWEAIKKTETVTITIDFYFFGLVFFRNNGPKQDFILKF